MRLVVVFLFACSSTPKEPTIPKEKQEANCRPPVGHLVELVTAGETGSVPMAEKLRTALFDRCVADLWGADALQCFQTLETIDKADGCAKYLTIPQRDGFQQAIEGAMR